MLELHNDKVRVLISEEGAELLSLCDADNTEYLWQRDPIYWKRSSPILFPFVGRLPEARYAVDGISYDMPLHGFASKSRFSVTDQREDAATLVLEDSELTREVYPFSFRLCVRYSLRSSTVEIVYSVENHGKIPMPFGLGVHPGFLLPSTAAGSSEEYRISFDAPCRPIRHLVAPNNLMAGETCPHSLLHDTVLPTEGDWLNGGTLVFSKMSSRVTLAFRQTGRSISVAYPDAPFLAFWKDPHPQAHFLCIEPWLSLPAQNGGSNDLMQMPTLQHLSAHKRFDFRWSITV